MTNLVPIQNVAQQFYAAIDLRANLAASTRKQYRREVEKAVNADVDLRDASQVTRYASTLSTSSRSFLRAAVRAWSAQIQRDMKSQATPDNVDQIQAAVMRLEALDDAVELEKPTGERAHVWLTSREVRQLMTTVDTSTRRGRRDRLVLALLLAAGLRRRELANLRWRDVKKQGERVVLDVVGKGKKARVIPVKASVADYLDAWRRETNGADDERVVRGVARRLSQLTDSITPAQVYNIVRKYGKRIGKATLAPHDLRRTYAQLGLDNGVPITQLSKLLGHSSVAVTERYLNVELDLEVTASDFIPV